MYTQRKKERCIDIAHASMYNLPALAKRGLDTNFGLLGSYIYANIREQQQQQQGKSKKKGGHPLYVST